MSEIDQIIPANGWRVRWNDHECYMEFPVVAWALLDTGKVVGLKASLDESWELDRIDEYMEYLGNTVAEFEYVHDEVTV